METSKEKEWLIGEIQVLTDGKLSHVDFNSDPDDQPMILKMILKR